MLHGSEGLSIFKKHSEQLFRGKDEFVQANERNSEFKWISESLFEKSSAKISQLELFILFEDRRTSRREPTRVIFCRVVESYYLIQMKI